MLVAVCYDVPDDRRRTRLAKLLEGFGARVQKSVFECDLNPKLLDRLKKKISRVVSASEDSLRYYYLCRDCQERIEVMNGPAVEKTKPYFVA